MKAVIVVAVVGLLGWGACAGVRYTHRVRLAAYVEGREAGARGFAIEANPYPSGPLYRGRWHAWRKGWHVGAWEHAQQEGQ